MFRKIYAITTENNFYKFRARCSREGYTMGEALTAIVHLFANSRELKLPTKVTRQPIVSEEKEIIEPVKEKNNLGPVAKKIKEDGGKLGPVAEATKEGVDLKKK